MTELQQLQELVRNDPACQRIFLEDIQSEFPAGATAAIRSRLEKAWQSTSDLQYCIRAAGLDDEGVNALIESDRQRMAAEDAADARDAFTEKRRRLKEERYGFNGEDDE
jgi:hypothetical protein